MRTRVLAVALPVVLMFAVLLAQPSGASASPGLLAQLFGTNGCIAQATDATCANDGRGLGGAASVVVSPDGKNAYSAANSNGEIAIFDRDPLTGALTQKPGTAGCITKALGDPTCDNTGRGIDSASTVTVAPDGKNVYVAGMGGNAIAIFDRNPATGVLTQKLATAGCITTAAGDPTCTTTGRALVDAYGVTVSADGKNVYVVSQTSDGVAIFDRDTGTGALTQKAGTAGCIVQGTDATCTNTGRALDAAWGAVVSPDGENVYVSSSTSDGVAIFDRDTGTGALTQKAGTAGCIVQGTDATCTNDGRGLHFARGLTISPDGKSVYVATQDYGYLAIFDRDVNTGGLAQKPAAAGCITGGSGTATCNTAGRAVSGAMAVAVSPDNSNVYVAAQYSDGVAIFDRDSGTGAVTQKSGADGCVVVGTDATCTNDGRGMDGAYDVALSADGLNVYVVAGNYSAKTMAILGRDRVPACQSAGPLATGHNKTISLMLSCSDPIGAPVTYSVVSPPAHGMLGTIDQVSGMTTYTPATGYSGSDSFTFKATARGFDSLPVTVTIDVAPAPTISSLKVRPTTFRAARRGPSASARPPQRANVSFDLNRAAKVTFTVQRAIKGRKRGRKCSTKPRRGKRCTIYRTRKGSFTRDGVAGANSFRFSGRLGARKLPPGKYRLVATPRADETDGKPAQAHFRIVR